jgi:uncharacterized membrane protein YvbJ
MAGFPVTCDKCGRQLNDVNECPQCGPAPKTVHVQIRSQIGLTARVSMTVDRLREEIKKNWLWIVITLAIDLVSIYGAFVLTGIPSALAAVVAILVTAFTGYRAVTKVRTITRETR